MSSWLWWESSCNIFLSNTTRIIWWKYISVYRGYLIGTFKCITKGWYKFNYTITSTSCSVSLFLSDNRKHDAATTTEHSNHLIALLTDKKVLTTYLSKIWENTDGCAEQYICASALYLMSGMPQCYSVIIYWGISAPGNRKEVVDGRNSFDKRYIYQCMSNVQLPGSNKFDSQMQMHTSNQTDYVSLDN